MGDSKQETNSPALNIPLLPEILHVNALNIENLQKSDVRINNKIYTSAIIDIKFNTYYNYNFM